MSRLTAGCIHKVIFRYSSKWWNEKGLNGVFLSDAGPLSFVTDHSASFNGKEFIGLVGFLVGKYSTELRQTSPEQRKMAILAQLEMAFQTKKVYDVVEWFEHDWAQEEWSRGCYMGTLPTGILTQMAEHVNYNRTPWNNIYFAATEYSTIWAGYMEGAVLSGYTTARQILHARPTESQPPYKDPKRYQKSTIYLPFQTILKVIMFSTVLFAVYNYVIVS